jgi:hypothetical protein
MTTPNPVSIVGSADISIGILADDVVYPRDDIATEEG